MSYCRFSEHSDVYAYAHVDGGFHVHVACDVPLPRAGEGIVAWDSFGFLATLRELSREGYRVPRWATDRILLEIAHGSKGALVFRGHPNRNCRKAAKMAQRAKESR